MKKNSQLSTLNSQLNQGYIALTSMLVISAVALAIAVSISLLGVDEARSSLSFKKGQETLKTAESCFEEAMLRLRDNSAYAGGSLSLGDGSCTISISGSGNARVIDVTAQILGPPLYIKNIQVNVAISGNSINIVSWKEVQ